MQTLTSRPLYRESNRRLEDHFHQLHLSTQHLVCQGQMSEQLLQAILRPEQCGSSHSLSKGELMEDRVDYDKTAISSGLSQPPSKASITHFCPDGMSFSTHASDPIRFDLRCIRSCRAPCSCSCHIKTRLKTPSILDYVLGLLFITYNSRPLTSMSGKCNLSSCRKQGLSTAEITYTFPRWFIQRMIAIKVKSMGPELILRVSRIRPKNAAIFLALENNNVEIARELLTAGEASVLDVNQEGQSLIHVRPPLYLQNNVDLIGVKCALGRYWPTHDILKLLLDAGADIMQEDSNQM